MRLLKRLRSIISLPLWKKDFVRGSFFSSQAQHFCFLFQGLSALRAEFPVSMLALRLDCSTSELTTPQKVFIHLKTG